MYRRAGVRPADRPPSLPRRPPRHQRPNVATTAARSRAKAPPRTHLHASNASQRPRCPCTLLRGIPDLWGPRRPNCRVGCNRPGPPRFNGRPPMRADASADTGPAKAASTPERPPPEASPKGAGRRTWTSLAPTPRARGPRLAGSGPILADCGRCWANIARNLARLDRFRAELGRSWGTIDRSWSYRGQLARIRPNSTVADSAEFDSKSHKSGRC